MTHCRDDLGTRDCVSVIQGNLPTRISQETLLNRNSHTLRESPAISQGEHVLMQEITMAQWIVEGTRLDSFVQAQSAAQEHADRYQALVPLIKDCGQGEWLVVKMICPRQKISRARVGPAYRDGTFHPMRSAPGAAAPAWDQQIPNRMN